MNSIPQTTHISTNGFTIQLTDMIVGGSAVQPAEQPEETHIEEPEINVLDVQPVKNLNLGWITRYADVMTAQTASPREFHELAALVAVATAIEGKARLKMAFGTIRSNLYGCIVAASTVYGKSTSIKKPALLLEAATLDRLLISSHGTSEGLVRTLAAQPNALMIRDEIGTLFGSDKVKYMKDFKQDLTYLYDGTPYSRALSGQTVEVKKPYLNILGATTPARFYENINRNDWLDGMLPRWLFVMPEGEPDFEAVAGIYTPEHEAEINRLSWELMELNRQPEKDFMLEGNSYQLFADWRKAGLKAAYQQNDEVAMAIIGRYATYALKFAIILASINGSYGVITEETIQTAIYLADNYKANVHKIIEQSGKNKIGSNKILRVFNAIHKRTQQGTPPTARELQQTTSLSKGEVDEILDRLTQAGYIDSQKCTAKCRTVEVYISIRDEIKAKSL